MEVIQYGTSSLKELNNLLAPYILPRNTWNPTDESLYKPFELYRVHLEEAREMQLKIKYTFTHHYNNNDFCRKYCNLKGVRPEDINTSDDLDTIFLLPDITFKQYPPGEEFAHWFTSIYTGDLPTVVIEGFDPTYEDIIDGNATGLVVTYSSGTCGRVTVIPRDIKTFQAAEYAFAKLTECMTDQTRYDIHILSADHLYLLSPNPTRTNLFIGKAISLSFDLLKDGDVQYTVDYEITMTSLQMAMRIGRE